MAIEEIETINKKTVREGETVRKGSRKVKAGSYWAGENTLIPMDRRRKPIRLGDKENE